MCDEVNAQLDVLLFVLIGDHGLATFGLELNTFAILADDEVLE